jgi:hypothetical protein
MLLSSLGSGAVHRLCELYPGICLTTEEKHGKTSVKVEVRTSQTDRVQYKKINSTIHRKKTVTQRSTMSQNNTENRIHNREKSPYQVSKPCVKLYKKNLN